MESMRKSVVHCLCVRLNAIAVAVDNLKSLAKTFWLHCATVHYIRHRYLFRLFVFMLFVGIVSILAFSALGRSFKHGKISLREEVDRMDQLFNLLDITNEKRTQENDSHMSLTTSTASYNHEIGGTLSEVSQAAITFNEAASTAPPTHLPSPIEITRTGGMSNTCSLRNASSQAVFNGSILNKHPLGKTLPHVLIIGARKAGTGILRDFLATHPHISSVSFETGFFTIDGCYKLGLAFYRSLLPLPKPNQIVLEKTAEYFHHPYVPQRVHAMNASIKILLIVKDPYKRMLSDFMFLRRYKKKPNAEEKTQSFEELLLNKTTGQIITSWNCLQRSLYVKHIKEWLKWFQRDRIHIVNGSRMSSENPAIELSRVETFLGIQQYLTEDKFFFNATKGFYCARSIGCYDNKGHEPITVQPSVEKRAREYLAEYNQMFYEAVGVDYGW